jgi:hypothetical protein
MLKHLVTWFGSVQLQSQFGRNAPGVFKNFLL